MRGTQTAGAHLLSRRACRGATPLMFQGRGEARGHAVQGGDGGAGRGGDAGHAPRLVRQAGDGRAGRAGHALLGGRRGHRQNSSAPRRRIRQHTPFDPLPPIPLPPPYSHASYLNFALSRPDKPPLSRPLLLSQEFHSLLPSRFCRPVPTPTKVPIPRYPFIPFLPTRP